VALGTSEVSRFIAPAPTTAAEYRRFIAWSRRVSTSRSHLVYGVVPQGSQQPIGLMHLWRLEPDFSVAECGFVLGEAWWGSGVFLDGARALLRYGFAEFGIHRLEARSAVGNARGNAAMRKLGLECEGRLRSCFHIEGGFADHYMWAALAHEWRQRVTV